MRKRKCKACGETIDLVLELSKVVYVAKKKGFMHKECYKKQLVDKGLSSEDADNIIHDLSELTQVEIEKALKPKEKKSREYKRGSSENPRLMLTDWLLENYGVSLIPKAFYLKLDSVYKGTFKGLKHPCPPEDLLQMWQRGKPYLDKVAFKNKQKGKDMTEAQRLSYDLAILLSKYEDFLEWRERQQQAAQAESRKEAPHIQYNRLNYQKVNQNPREDLVSSAIDDDEF